MNAFTKKGACQKNIFILSWLVFSIPFVIWVLWSMFLNVAHNSGLEKGFAQGRFQGYSEIVQAASNKDCAPFPVDFQEKTITLVNVACLQRAVTPPPTEIPMTDKKTEETEG